MTGPIRFLAPNNGSICGTKSLHISSFLYFDELLGQIDTDLCRTHAQQGYFIDLRLVLSVSEN